MKDKAKMIVIHNNAGLYTVVLDYTVNNASGMCRHIVSGTRDEVIRDLTPIVKVRADVLGRRAIAACGEIK